MEKIFYINCYSKARIIITYLISLISLFIITILWDPNNVLHMAVIIAWMIISGGLSLFVLPKYVAKSILQITIIKEDVKFDWVKPYWKGIIKAPIACKIKDFKSYKIESTNNFKTIKIKFNSGEKIIIHNWRNDSNDDMNKFMTQLINVIDNYNNKKSTTPLIEEEKSITENKVFLIIIGFLIILLIVLFILVLIFKGISNPKGFIPIFIVIGPLVWVISRIIKVLRKN